MNRIDELPPLREVVAEYQLTARKSLGQNYLFDTNLTDKIVRKAGSLKGYDILEVGPGPGGLTRSIAVAGARRIVAVEKDERCLPALRVLEEATEGLLRVVHADALKVDLESLVSPPARIVANLPYNVGTELFVRWLSATDWPPPWRSLTLAFQKEVAQRIVAGPGSKQYGRISVLAQWRSSPVIAMNVPPSAFVPPPKVTTSIVHLELHPGPKYEADIQILKSLVKAAFSQRRKMLRSILRSISPKIESIITSAGVNPEARADSVSVSDYCALARVLAHELNEAKMGGNRLG